MESHGLSEYLSSDGKWRNGSVNHPGVFTGLATISDHELFVIGGATSLVSAWRNSAHVLNVRTQAAREVGGGLSFAMMRTSCTRFRLKNGTEVVLCVGGRCDSCQATPNVNHNQVIVFNIEHEWLMLKPEWDLPVRGRGANLFVSRDGILYLLGGGTFETKSFQFNEGGSPVWVPIHPVPNSDDFMAFEISYIRT
ncbi:hypothetical protein TCAL_14247 [Tigriopus californicus]|uniref:Uncharacterized protein n=1 Tax=Tigriopus californicus TaxID=6832 RepID=A0A553NSQ3_TIGCA|nr:hypothetical protein TCAL_14247 [Tigriopus californicus]